MDDHALTAVHDHREVAAQAREQIEHRLKLGHHGEARQDAGTSPLVQVVELVALRADA
jgi:hypothetical protein